MLPEVSSEMAVLTEAIHVRLTAGQREFLAERAEETGATPQAIIRLLVNRAREVKAAA